MNTTVPRSVRRLIVACYALLALVSAFVCPSSAPAAEPLRTFDGKYPIREIHLTAVYFVPRDRTPLPDWQDRVRYFCRRLDQFHAREFQGQSRLTIKIHAEPLVSDKDSAALQAGDADFIFFQTMNEAQMRLDFARGKDDAFPILLVLSDINWRELDDFWRLRSSDGQFEGHIIGDRHFPGAASGGARSLYQPDRGVGWGLVSGDGWRVPYSGTDSVVYHEGVGHPIGLPHPEPGDDSVMSQAQYKYWLNETWIDEPQKRKLGWQPTPEKPQRADSLFSAFTAVPEPRVPRPAEPVKLTLAWPPNARLRQGSLQTQTDLFGPWHRLSALAQGPPPKEVSLGQFDRPTPVSYRVAATLDDGQEVELWVTSRSAVPLR